MACIGLNLVETSSKDLNAADLHRFTSTVYFVHNVFFRAHSFLKRSCYCMLQYSTGLESKESKVKKMSKSNCVPFFQDPMGASFLLCQ